MSIVTEKKPKGLILALGMSEPPEGLIYSSEDERERLTREMERLERGLEGYRQVTGQTRAEFEKHILGKDDYARLEQIRKELGEFGKPKKVTPPEPELKTKKSEDEKARGRWRKANSEFHPYKLLGERLKEKEEAAGNGAKIMGLFDDAMKKADEFDYGAAIGFLKEATKLAEESQKAIDQERKRVAEETNSDEDRQKKAFDFVVIVKDKDYGFDPDMDAENFYLANTIGEGGVGTLKKSEKLKEMEEILGKCGERKRKLQAAGATIDEIVSTVYKHVPESLWPDDVVKEVVLYKAVTKQVESEKELEEAEDQLKEMAEKSETAGDVLEALESGTEWAKETFGEKSEKFGESMEIMGTFAKSFSLANSLLGSGASGLSAGEKHQELEEIEDNPVKEKIVEFERNKAIVECVNGLFDMGLSEASQWVPVLNAVTKGKDSLMEVAKAGYYFKNTLNLKVLEKGAKTDPRSAALLPLARLAREQKIALSEAAFKAVGSALETASKGLELAAVAAPAGLALDITGKVLTYGSKAIITGINWSDASKAAKLIQQAAGPPPLRRAQIEVMKYSSKYAKVAVVHLAMKERDPWAIGHLENVGLGREDIDHPKTTSKLIREYMALKAGGILGDEQGEDQETIGESFLGKAGEKIADAAEWVRDKVVGRNTKIEYDPSWRAESHDLSVEDWKAAKSGAIAAGWYDSRPDIEGDLASYAEAASAYNQANASNIEASLAAASDVMAALGSLRAEFQKIKPVTNDKKTEHAGMKAFLFDCWKLAGQRLDIVTETRSRYLDEQSFPGLKGEALEQAKKKMLDDAIEKAKVDQTKKMAARKKAIADLWDNYEIKTPYAKCKLLDFPKEVKGGLLKFGAAGSLDFGDTEVSELAVEVNELRKSALERLNSELMSSPDKDLSKNFKASAMTAEKYIVEALRATCERLFEAKQRKEGKSSPPLWAPKPADIVLDWETWRNVIEAAKDGGWDQEENTGFTDSLKAYQKSLESYEAETQKSEPNVTIVEQQRGIILGSIEELEGKLRKFKPVTKQKFFHPGLIAYRDGMIELCVAARITFGSAI